MPKKKIIKVASRKAKARILQNWTCEQVSKATQIPWGKIDDAEIKPRPMGQSGADVILSSRARKAFPFTVECKNQLKWNILAWIEQVKANLYPDTDWLLVLKRSGPKKKDQTKEVVVLDAEVFFEMIKRLKRN